MKTRHYQIIKNKILSRDFVWLADQIKKYFSILASEQLGRPLSGPILGGIIVTYRCNLKCVMCDYFEKNKRYTNRFGKEMDIDEIKKIVDEYAEMGTSGIGFTGGEPLLRDDLVEIIKHTQKRGIVTSIGTNGLLLDTERSKRILGAGVQNIQVSLDAPNPEIHDKIRGVKGAFSKAVRGFENIVRERNAGNYKTRLMISTCITFQNYKFALDMIDAAKKMGADNLSFIGFEPLALEENAEERIRSLEITGQYLKELEETIDTLISIKRHSDFIDNSIPGLKIMKHQFKGEKLPIKCHAGYTSLYVDCFGNIFPCQAYAEMGKAIYNLNDGSLKDFWNSSEYSKIRGKLSVCRECFFPCHSELSALYNFKFRLFNA